MAGNNNNIKSKRTWSKKGFFFVILGWLTTILGFFVDSGLGSFFRNFGYCEVLLGYFIIRHDYRKYFEESIREKETQEKMWEQVRMAAQVRVEEELKEREKPKRIEEQKLEQAKIAAQAHIEKEQREREEQSHIEEQKREQERQASEERLAKYIERVNHLKAEFSSELMAIPRQDIPIGEKVNRKRASDMPLIEYKNITRRTNISKLFPLVVIDIETTGLNARDDIIEVAAIKYTEGFVPESCCSVLCKPRKPIPEETTEINGITNEMVAECPLFSTVANGITEYIKGCNIVGHYLEFDIKRLFVGGVEFSDKVRYYDTLELVKRVLKASYSKKYNYHTNKYEEVEFWDVVDYKLDTLCDHYGIYRDDAHRALSDCFATAMLFKNLIYDKTSIEI